MVRKLGGWLSKNIFVKDVAFLSKMFLVNGKFTNRLLHFVKNYAFNIDGQLNLNLSALCNFVLFGGWCVSLTPLSWKQIKREVTRDNML